MNLDTSYLKKTVHNSGPPKQTYYCGSGLLMDYPLEKLFECCFQKGFNKPSYILEIKHFENSKKIGAKKVKINKNVSKGKEKERRE